MNVRIGISGWYYRDWKGLFYPPDLPQKAWLPYYASHFNTVELNSTFYSWPRDSTIAAWPLRTPETFAYSVKVNRRITHELQFNGTESLVADFSRIADSLGDRMGCLLFQLPPQLHYTPAQLDNILAQLRPGCRNVLEFRHRSWWTSDVYAACRNAGAIFCCVSAPGLPDDLIQTADDIYLRFHGATRWYRYRYSDDELLFWTQRLRAVAATRAWIYFNNAYDANAITNARTLARQLAD